MLFSDRPPITLYSVYKNHQLRLPSLYAMIILLLFYVAHILCQLLFSLHFLRVYLVLFLKYMTYMLLFDVILIPFTLLLWCYHIILYSSYYIFWPTALRLLFRSLIFFFQYACYSSKHSDSASGASNFAK